MGISPRELTGRISLERLALAMSCLRKLQAFTLIIVGLLGGALFCPLKSYALDQSVATVIKCGEYGIVGGTILGLASLSFSKKPRTVFIGSSLGLYAGILAGFYYASHPEDPYNPFRPNADEPELIHTRGPSVPPGAMPVGDSTHTVLVSFEVLSF
ncbi:hypothetical protein WDW86_12705 [Bdellovibrionota bacterium FG-2]